MKKLFTTIRGADFVEGLPDIENIDRNDPHLIIIVDLMSEEEL